MVHRLNRTRTNPTSLWEIPRRPPNAAAQLTLWTRFGTHEVTQLLVAWSDGDEVALDRLAPLVNAELHRLAKRYLSRERDSVVGLTKSELTTESQRSQRRHRDFRF